MKNPSAKAVAALSPIVVVLAVFVWAGCSKSTSSPPDAAKRVVTSAPQIQPLTLALAPHEGISRLDNQIRDFQARVRTSRSNNSSIERLGWLYVAKARESFDPGFYKLAEACAAALDANSHDCPEGLLLRGHVLENLHRFHESEAIARTLVAKRGLSFDYSLLGDALMEQGRLDEAAVAYQQMMDIRPDPHAYSRAAHLRWLKGDLEGATELMQTAADAGSYSDPEASAWFSTRLGFYQFQAGNSAAAQQSCDNALAFETNYAPALLLRGRMLLAQKSAAAAVEALSQAERINPLPDYQWTLAEALRAANRVQEAKEVESRLRRSGAANDPRTYSLYLATSSDQTAEALRLARDEMSQRQDVFSHDALAWALRANRQMTEARHEMELALAEHTDDARLYFHAMVIAADSGDDLHAKEWAKKAATRMHLLLPAERNEFQTLASKIHEHLDVAALPTH